MADETGKVDIFVIDDSPNREYISLLRDKGFVVEVVTSQDKEDKERFYAAEKTAKVFIFSYEQDSLKKDASDASRILALSGVDLAKVVRQWCGHGVLVHLVSSSTAAECPLGCKDSWAELQKSLINSYSGRDRESFSPHLASIEAALKPK